jgi:hypothetical protein
MSTIRVDNFGPSAGGTTYSARGIAKAWANIAGGGQSVLGSLNVSSVTDSGVGAYTLTYTSAFDSVDNQSLFGASLIASSSTYTPQINATTVSTAYFIIRRTTNDTVQDYPMYSTIHGDLA